MVEETLKIGTYQIKYLFEAIDAESTKVDGSIVPKAWLKVY